MPVLLLRQTFLTTVGLMHSDAGTVDEYLASLEPHRREQMQRTLDAVRPHLPAGLDEAMDFGMITWSVPLSVKPDTYNGKPLMFAALASQKRHISLYLTNLYAGSPIDEDEFRARWAGAKRLDMGKSCVRFRSLDDVDVPLIQQVLEGVTVEQFVQRYEQVKGQRQSR